MIRGTPPRQRQKADPFRSLRPRSWPDFAALHPRLPDAADTCCHPIPPILGGYSVPPDRYIGSFGLHGTRVRIPSLDRQRRDTARPAGLFPNTDPGWRSFRRSPRQNQQLLRLCHERGHRHLVPATRISRGQPPPARAVTRFSSSPLPPPAAESIRPGPAGYSDFRVPDSRPPEPIPDSRLRVGPSVRSTDDPAGPLPRRQLGSCTFECSASTRFGEA